MAPRVWSLLLSLPPLPPFPPSPSYKLTGKPLLPAPLLPRVSQDLSPLFSCVLYQLFAFQMRSVTFVIFPWSYLSPYWQLIHYFIVFTCLGVSSLLDCGTFPRSVAMLDLLLTRTPSTSRPISAQCQMAEWLNSNAWFQSKFLEYVLFCEVFLQITFLVGHILARGK